MKTRLLISALAILMASLACDTSTTGGGAPQKDISGTYTLSGTSFDGTSYEGEATIAKVSGSTYSIIWQIGSNQTQTGTGTLTGTNFDVTWKEGDLTGTATYTLQSDGSLKGVWKADGKDGQGTETFTPK